MLTGKNKEQFESYYLNLPNSMGLNYGNRQTTLNRFYSLPLSMQWGVYQDFADSIGYDISTYKSLNDDLNGYVYISSVNDDCIDNNHKTRKEAQIAALKAFDKLINGSNKHCGATHAT